MTPKYRKGQSLRHVTSGVEIHVNFPNMKRYLVRKQGRTTGFEDEFIGTYNCSWFDRNGKLVSGDIDEDLLARPSDTSSKSV